MKGTKGNNTVKQKDNASNISECMIPSTVFTSLQELEEDKVLEQIGTPESKKTCISADSKLVTELPNSSSSSTSKAVANVTKILTIL